jgi:plastocyanin
MTRRRRLLQTGAAALAAGVAGCTGGDTGGGDGEDDGDDGTTDEADTTDGGTTDGVDATVSVRNFAFAPARVEVPTGGTVRWAFEEGSHDVTSAQFHDSAADWDHETDTLGSGETASFTFESAGVYEYLCSIHGRAQMSGAVLVGGATLEQSLPSENDDGGGGGDDGSAGTTDDYY